MAPQQSWMELRQGVETVQAKLDALKQSAEWQAVSTPEGRQELMDRALTRDEVKFVGDTIAKMNQSVRSIDRAAVKKGLLDAAKGAITAYTIWRNPEKVLADAVAWIDRQQNEAPGEGPAPGAEPKAIDQVKDDTPSEST